MKLSDSAQAQIILLTASLSFGAGYRVSWWLGLTVICGVGSVVACWVFAFHDFDK